MRRCPKYGAFRVSLTTGTDDIMSGVTRSFEVHLTNRRFHRQPRQREGRDSDSPFFAWHEEVTKFREIKLASRNFIEFGLLFSWT